jgi:hypothetical protein
LTGIRALYRCSKGGSQWSAIYGHIRPYHGSDTMNDFNLYLNFKAKINFLSNLSLKKHKALCQLEELRSFLINLIRQTIDIYFLMTTYCLLSIKELFSVSSIPSKEF